MDSIYTELSAYVTDGDMWLLIGTRILRIILILIVAAIAIRVGKAMIQRIFRQRDRGPRFISERREATLVKLLENVLTYVIYFVVIMMVLETVGIPIRALLAGAGILGLAVGFGAQNLVRDIITGFFIIFEDQFSVGDYVRIGAFEGAVEEIGLRTTKIKSAAGELHIIPNGSIMEVTNFSIHNSVAIVDVSIAYESDISKAEQVIEQLLQELPSRYEEIVNVPQLLGIQNLAASEVVMRITCEVQPMKHWYMSRMIRKEVKNRLDEYGIEIPFPRLVLYNRNDDSNQTNQENQKGRG
ncbi:mechanosensitive ion channel family protein [Fredinandcohnia sp. 179-A 10B2 NHS]